MTIAICVRCGEQKLGALTPCPGCHYDPAPEPDRRIQARCLWLSDRYLQPEQLKTVGAQLKAGQPVAFDERMLDALVIQLQTQHNSVLAKSQVGCTLFVWVLAAVMLGLIAWVVFLLQGPPS
jgi:hypothetical protein